MANPLVTPNMFLVEPAIGNTLSPTWAQDLNNNFTTLDQHNHAPGSGVQIPPDGLNISSDLTFQSNNATNLRTTRYIPISLGSLTGSDIGAIVVDTAGDLYYVNEAGLQIQITNSSGIVGTPGSISGLVSPASASYVSATGTFVWQQGSSIPANMDAATYILRYPSAGYPTPSGNFVALQAPSALATGYPFTFATMLPSSGSFLTLDTSGQVGYITQTGGITGSMIGSATITGNNIVSDVVLAGSPSTVGGLTVGVNLSVTTNAAVGGLLQFPLSNVAFEAFNANTISIVNQGTTNAFPIVTSPPGSPSGIELVSGVVGSSGSVNAGVGFSSAHTSTGVYTISLNYPFGTVYSAVATPQTSLGSALVAHCTTISDTTLIVEVFNTVTNGSTDSNFSFIMTGTRNS